MASRRPVSARWSRVPSVCSHLFDNVPMHRTKAAVSYSWPFLYVLGGRSGHVICRDFWRFNVENDQWEEIYLEEQPLLENHAACWHNQSLYIFGGQFAHQTIMLMWKEGQRRFLPAKLTRSHDQAVSKSPLNVRGHTLVSFSDFIYLFGGWSDTMGASNQMWKFDPGSTKWAELKTPRGPSPRHGHSAVVFGQSMWIFGGIRNFDVLGDLWRIECDSTGSLVRCEEVKCRYSPGARYGHSACVIGQKMFIFGGYNTDGLATDNFWCFDFIDRSWQNITPDRKPDDPMPILWPQASAFHRCVAVEPPRHRPLIDIDDRVTLATPFQRNGAASSSADSGYTTSSYRTSDSAATSSADPQWGPSNQKSVTSLNRSNGSTSTGPLRPPTGVRFAQSVAADNHAYSDEEDLGVVQERNEEDDCSFALPGSIMGDYEDEKWRKRPSTAFISHGCNIELKPIHRPSEVTPVEIITIQNDQVASTSFSSQSNIGLETPPEKSGLREISIYLVGSTCTEGNASKNLKIWICHVGDDTAASCATVHTVQ